MKRIGKLMLGSFLAVHLFASFFHMCAKFNDYDVNTWVYNKGIVDKVGLQMYFQCMYWAFQTLTTVGYGDFGAYNAYEILITILWMAFGVIFYSMVVGTLTSVITEEGNDTLSLAGKINAFE